jgi:hypothetical protein
VRNVNGRGLPVIGYPRPCYTIVNARKNIPTVINRNVTYTLPFQQKPGSIAFPMNYSIPKDSKIHAKKRDEKWYNCQIHVKDNVT